MGSYRITMDEFLQLYQDFPDYKVLYRANSRAKNEMNGNTEETNKELKNMKKMSLKKLKFWKKGEDAVEICNQEDVNNNNEAESKQKKNPIGKIMRSFGRVMLRHFYFMNVAIENTGGIYVVRYGSPDQSCGMQLEYCYTSSYATTRSSMVYCS